MRIITFILILTSFNISSDEVNDPFEELNRKTFEFNEKLDSTILRPTAEVYSKFPPKVKTGVTNFFNNLEEIDTSVNQLLQGKPKKALNDMTRFIINSTIGIAGLFDVASKYLERHEEDFGQTLAAGFQRGQHHAPFFRPINT